MTTRDPSVDHPHELFPDTRHVEDLSDVLVTAADGQGVQVVGENVDGDGVAHFLRITEDGDYCGGCGKAWPCPGRVPVQVLEQPRVDPDLVAAVAEALKKERDAGLLA